jgi:hypothetical protein
LIAQAPAPAHKTDAAIQQVNLGYNAEQDRLLLRVGLSDNSELLVWLTNRITKLLWQLLTGETNLPTATSIQAETPPNKAVEQFKQEVQATETLEKMDFVTEYQPRKEVVNNGAMLAAGLALVSYQQKPPTLEIACLEGITVRMNLTQELILALCNMLQLSSKEAAWDIEPPVKTQLSAPIQANAEVKKVLH